MLSQMQSSRFLEGENKSGRAICADFYLSAGIVRKWKQELLQHALRAFDSDFGEKIGGRKVAYLIRCFSLGELSPNWWGGPSFSEYDLGEIYRYNGSGSYWGDRSGSATCRLHLMNSYYTGGRAIAES